LKVVLMSVFSQGAVLDAAVDWLSKGWLNLSWWQLVLVTLAMTHITIVSVTVFLHRHQAHRALDLHPLPSHFFRFWLWLTTGQVTREWAAIHRKHHARCEQAEDPHSPHVFGIRKVLFEGAELYRTESKNQETLARFGHGTPDDWIERHLYTRFSSGRGPCWHCLALFGARPDCLGRSCRIRSRCRHHQWWATTAGIATGIALTRAPMSFPGES
jgi:stearoyl-CoA desaturase (delta-9 desaturase)